MIFLHHGLRVGLHWKGNRWNKEIRGNGILSGPAFGHNKLTEQKTGNPQDSTSFQFERRKVEDNVLCKWQSPPSPIITIKLLTSKRTYYSAVFMLVFNSKERYEARGLHESKKNEKKTKLETGSGRTYVMSCHVCDSLDSLCRILAASNVQNETLTFEERRVHHWSIGRQVRL